ncbi:DUF6489 family protein [Caulobacter sp. NIBR1757]|uniref:DUF6489 family protein n=1 Tax=Caulobacter sp. NIBR1757 TaxID=3016000 RepID=UPI0022EFF1F3|nr:DUF6489 family protein [Caulobacter sp. NIBR1757]WGM37171.1 hypothetical protein AMEJIAPC_00065 [Caulobacter sp. NIBR1757]
MKVTVEIDCTPQEARTFLGLPDVTTLNDHMMAEMQKRMDANMAALAPEELMKTWMSFGMGAQEQFRKLMTAAATGAMGGSKGK